MFPTLHLPTRTRTNWRTPALLAAAGLGAAFLYVQTKKSAAERDNPPAGKFVDVDGVRLHYIERGQGPDLVLLHGNGLFANDFELSGLLDQAAKDYHVIAFDRPGFGYSERPSGTQWTPEAQARLIYLALHQLRIERPLVVGHSWATLVALAMALDFPKYVRGIALVSGYFFPTGKVDAALAAVPAIPVLGHFLRYTVSPLMGRMMWPRLVRRMFEPAAAPDRFASVPVWMSLRPSQLGASAAEAGLMIPAAERLSKRYAELTMPVAVIAGSGDAIVGAEQHSVKLHKEISHSALSLEPGVGHMVHYAKPERVMEAVAALQAQVS